MLLFQGIYCLGAREKGWHMGICSPCATERFRSHDILRRARGYADSKHYCQGKQTTHGPDKSPETQTQFITRRRRRRRRQHRYEHNTYVYAHFRLKCNSNFQMCFAAGCRNTNVSCIATCFIAKLHENGKTWSSIECSVKSK